MIISDTFYYIINSSFRFEAVEIDNSLVFCIVHEWSLEPASHFEQLNHGGYKVCELVIVQLFKHGRSAVKKELLVFAHCSILFSLFNTYKRITHTLLQFFKPVAHNINYSLFSQEYQIGSELSNLLKTFKTAQIA